MQFGKNEPSVDTGSAVDAAVASSPPSASAIGMGGMAAEEDDEGQVIFDITSEDSGNEDDISDVPSAEIKHQDLEIAG